MSKAPSPKTTTNDKSPKKPKIIKSNTPALNAIKNARKKLKSIPTSNDVLSDKQIFIRNLPYNMTSKELEQLFSTCGSIKKCFMINKKNGISTFNKKGDNTVSENEDNSRGFAFVEFNNVEDTQRSIGEFNNYNYKDRVLSVELAKKKKRVDEKEKEKLKLKRNKDTIIAAIKIEDEDNTTADDDKSKKTDKKVVLEKKFSPPIKSSKPKIVDDLSRTVLITGLPIGTDKEHVWKRVKKFGECSCLIFPAPESTPTQTAARIVYSTPRIAQIACESLSNRILFGEVVTSSILPRKSARLILRNLAFNVNVEDIRAAFTPRYIITDLSLPLDDKNKCKGFAFVEVLGEDMANDAIKKINGTTIKNRVVAIDWALSKTLYLQQAEANNEVIAKNEPKEEKKPKAKKAENKKEPINGSSDVTKGCTLFIKNLPFSCTEESLVEFFNQFGKVEYAKLVMLNGECKGTGFVKMIEKESADFILSEYSSSLNTSDEHLFEGRPLTVTLAVDRKTAEEENIKKFAKEDKKRAFLAREGLILADMAAAEELSKQDIDKRTKLWEETKEKLKNPNYVVSSTRLSVKNMPPFFDEKQVKNLFFEAATNYLQENPKEFEGDNKVGIYQVIVCKETDRFNPDGTIKSKGFGFVEFSTHNAAMAALRQLNNNPAIFKPEKRPIVTFAIEDQKKLKSRDDRLVRTGPSAPVKPAMKEFNESTTVGNKRKVESFENKDSNQAFKKLKVQEKTKLLLKNNDKPAEKINGNVNKDNIKQKQMVQEQPKEVVVKKVAPNPNNKRRNDAEDFEPPAKVAKNKEKKVEAKDKFENMVQEYKNKLLSGNLQKSSKKWYEE